MQRTRFDDELDLAKTKWRYRPAPDLLKGRVILVTGAGAGIGAVAAATFARYGANVVLLGRTQSALEEVHDDIVAATPTDPTIATCDLGRVDATALLPLAEQLEEHYGKLDGLLHNAGALGARALQGVSYDVAYRARRGPERAEIEVLALDRSEAAEDIEASESIAESPVS